MGEGEIVGPIYRNGHTYISRKDCIKPILRPLSDLTIEIEVNGEKFVPGEDLSELMDIYDLGYNDHYYDYKLEKYIIDDPCREPYFVIQKMFEWHFDVFDLIKRGDAIDINTLK